MGHFGNCFLAAYSVVLAQGVEIYFIECLLRGRSESSPREFTLEWTLHIAVPRLRRAALYSLLGHASPLQAGVVVAVIVIVVDVVAVALGGGPGGGLGVIK